MDLLPYPRRTDRESIEADARHVVGMTPEERAEVFAGPSYATFYRADVDAEGGGDLVIRAVKQVAECEDFPVTRIEFLHAGGDEFRKFIGRGNARRIGCIAGNEVGERGVGFVAERTVEGERGVPPTAEEIPVAVAREIHGDAVEPGGERGISAETREPAVRTDEGILGELFGIGAIAEQ